MSERGDYRELYYRDFGEEGVKHYRRRRYAGLDQKIINWIERRIVKRWLKGIGGGALLDIPCGYGRFSRILSDFNFTVGADLSFDMLKMAFPNYHMCVRSDVLKVPFKSNSFKVVLCIRLLHHTEIWQKAEDVIAELRRVSSRYVIISVYEKTLLHALWRKIKGRGSIYFTKRKDVIDLLRKCGFEIMSRKKVIPFFHAQVFYFLKKRGGCYNVNRENPHGSSGTRKKSRDYVP